MSTFHCPCSRSVWRRFSVSWTWAAMYYRSLCHQTSHTFSCQPSAMLAVLTWVLQDLNEDVFIYLPCMHEFQGGNRSLKSDAGSSADTAYEVQEKWVRWSQVKWGLTSCSILFHLFSYLHLSVSVWLLVLVWTLECSPIEISLDIIDDFNTVDSNKFFLVGPHGMFRIKHKTSTAKYHMFHDSNIDTFQYVTWSYSWHH